MVTSEVFLINVKSQTPIFQNHLPIPFLISHIKSRSKRTHLWNDKRLLQENNTF